MSIKDSVPMSASGWGSAPHDSGKTLHFAVIGAHNRGRLSRLLHRPEEGLFLSAVCGTRLEGLEEYRQLCGPDLLMTSDYREVLGRPEIDAVLVCTPDYLHAVHAIDALRAGKDVFLEKPMAITIADCDAIIAAAREAGRKLYVGHNMRFFPVMRKMRELIASGCIGQVEAVWCRHFINYGGDAYFKDWHSERKNTTGLLLQKGAHDIDIIHWLAGGYTRRVVGMGKLSVYNRVPSRRGRDEEGSAAWNPASWPPLSQQKLSPDIDVEDHSMILMQLDNGVQASYQQCHYTPDGHRNYCVIGTEGRLENYGDYSDDCHLATVHLWNSRRGYSPQGQEIFTIPTVSGSHGGSDPLMMADFVRFLRGEPSEGATPRDARMSVATGCLGTDSLRANSRPMDILPPPPSL